MNINFKQVIYNPSILGALQRKDVSLLCLVLLYHNGIINDKSYITNSLKVNDADKTLERYLSTYHSKINDKWYNDMFISDIYLDIVKEKCSDYNIEFANFLTYLNKALSKNRNYILNIFYYNYVKPLLNKYSIENSYEFLNNIVSIPEIEFESHYTSYCCDGCDGDYEQFRDSTNNLVYYEYIQKTRKAILSKLIEYKKHQKNILDKLIDEYNSII